MENYSNYSIDNIEHNWEKFYRLKEGDIYVEVGAFIGRYGLIAKKRKCSKIILIEPSPSNAKILEVNMNDANIDTGNGNVIIIKKAISDEKGNTTFCCGGDFNGHRMTNIKDPCRSCWSMDWILIEEKVYNKDEEKVMDNKKVDKINKDEEKVYYTKNKKRCIRCGAEVEIKGNDVIQVETDTIDNILEELKIDHVDLLACDCEGCEYCLVKGAKKYLVSGKIKNIALAIYHVNGNIQQEIINTLNSYGFKDLMFDREVVYGHI